MEEVKEAHFTVRQPSSSLNSISPTRFYSEKRRHIQSGELILCGEKSGDPDESSTDGDFSDQQAAEKENLL